MLASLQKIGGALMLPIAVLPIAGLLLRLGQPDLLHSVSMATAGQAIFSNLGLLFAIGVAVGLARENHGAAGLASVVAYLVATKGAEVLIAVPPEALADVTGRGRELAIAAYKARELSRLTVPVGLLSGLMAGALYNRFYNINLPSYLAFFGGRRFVPIVSGLGGLVLAFAFGMQWQHLEHGMEVLTHSVLQAGAFGMFAYGVLNRLLIVTGLHHIINYILWYLLGDQTRFFAGDPSAGVFMAGFFPVMLFGLPAACLAMYHTALPERRRVVGGLLGSIAFTSILTGVTEPIEFTFMFLAPALYAVHALLTGIAFIVMNALHVRLGFTFSAGLFDYVLNFSSATRPLWLLPVGAAYFALYYALFRFVIVRFDLKTPGREPEDTPAEAAPAAPAAKAAAWITALGGADNVRSVDACTTRLRLLVASQNPVNAEALRRLGARGLVRPSAEALQVVIGATADQLAGEIRAALQSASTTTAHVGSTQLMASTAAPPLVRRTVTAQTVHQPWRGDATRVLAALGGAGNIRGLTVAASRLLVEVQEARQVDRAALVALGLRAVAMPRSDCVHLIVGPAAPAASAVLRELLPAGSPGQ